MGRFAYPANMFPRIARIVLLWIAIMSGILSVAKDFWFAYLGSIGQPIPAQGTLVVLGHCALIAFVLSGVITLVLAERRIKELESKPTRLPIYIARRTILELEKKGKAMKAKLAKNKWFIPSRRMILRLREKYEEVLETYMSPHERAELLTVVGVRIDDPERSGHMLDFTDKKMELFDELHPLVHSIHIASRRIDNLRD